MCKNNYKQKKNEKKSNIATLGYFNSLIMNGTFKIGKMVMNSTNSIKSREVDLIVNKVKSSLLL